MNDLCLATFSGEMYEYHKAVILEMVDFFEHIETTSSNLYWNTYRQHGKFSVAVHAVVTLLVSNRVPIIECYVMNSDVDSVIKAVKKSVEMLGVSIVTVEDSRASHTIFKVGSTFLWIINVEEALYQGSLDTEGKDLGQKIKGAAYYKAIFPRKNFIVSDTCIEKEGVLCKTETVFTREEYSHFIDGSMQPPLF